MLAHDALHAIGDIGELGLGGAQVIVVEIALLQNLAELQVLLPFGASQLNSSQPTMFWPMSSTVARGVWMTSWA